MADLILRPSGLAAEGKPWALQLRFHESLGEVEYHTLTYVSDEVARQIEEAGAPFFLFGHPDAPRGPGRFPPTQATPTKDTPQ